MLVPEALRYQTYKTCTLALCRPDKTRQRRIWHKQSALCWSVPLTLTLSPAVSYTQIPTWGFVMSVSLL